MRAKVIHERGAVTLVEAVLPGRGVIRVYIPTDALRGEYADEFDVVSGIEYGLPWEDVLAQLLPDDKAARLARLLRESHLYTAEDARRNPNTIAAVVMRMWQVDASRIIALAQEFNKEKKK